MYVSPRIVPQRARVRPRVVRGAGGEALPLEEVVADALQAAQQTILWIRGRPFDRAAAMSHLAAVLPADASVSLLDEAPSEVDLAVAQSYKVDVYAGPGEFENAPALVLTDWARDEWIEYLLAAHRDRCRSVMGRLGPAAAADPLCAIPELCRIVLDEMAVDDEVEDPLRAMERFLVNMLDSPEKRTAWEQLALALLERRSTPSDDVPFLDPDHGALVLEDLGCSARLLQHAEMQEITAALHVASWSRAGHPSPFLKLSHEHAALVLTAALLAGDEPARAYLESLVSIHEPDFSSAAVSILVAIDPAWQPKPRCAEFLAWARLDGVLWLGVELPEALLMGALLRGADLQAADLDRSWLGQADLTGACLRCARLHRVRAEGARFVDADLRMVHAGEGQFRGCDLSRANLEGADLSHADLRDVDLTGARCLRADLKGAKFENARVGDADFSGAALDLANLSGLDLRASILRGASLVGARLGRCRMAELDLASAVLSRADLHGTDLTDAFMPRARLDRANLSHALLAGINWERADLREADLSRATFHMGTSRSGMVFSPLASEGTRTGFYTDEYLDQSFRSPEEIRVANLCGADLRGANIDRVDFYLVDLRGARLDPEQEEHARKCGAILGSRV